MPIRTATEWWNRHIDSPDFEEVNSTPIDVRLLMCAMFERAWNDLATTPDIKPQSRRSAIAWFNGVHADRVPFNYALCASHININKRREAVLRERIKAAESYMYGDGEEEEKEAA